MYNVHPTALVFYVAYGQNNNPDDRTENGKTAVVREEIEWVFDQNSSVNWPGL